MKQDQHIQSDAQKSNGYASLISLTEIIWWGSHSKSEEKILALLTWYLASAKENFVFPEHTVGLKSKNTLSSQAVRLMSAPGGRKTWACVSINQKILHNMTPETTRLLGWCNTELRLWPHLCSSALAAQPVSTLQ